MPKTLRLDSTTRASTTLRPGGDDEVTGVAPPPVARTARRCPACEQTFSGEARFCPYDGDCLVDAPDWNPGADPLLGRVVEARYQVLSVLGEGGMGTVYEVRHTTLDRRFALKVLRRDLGDPEMVVRFIQEAKAAAAIGHPHIVAVTDFGELAMAGGGRGPYFVMEMLTGTTLAALLKSEKTLAPARAAGIFGQCAAGLAAAHAAGVVHRDVKPDNVFLTGEREFVKLLDFGVAKMAGAGKLTRAGIVFGTPHYMSPEQASGQPVDHRCDIYAFGVMLYEALAGRVPFEADSYMGVLTKHQFAIPEPIDKAAPDGARLGALAPIVMRCLEKKAGDRFDSMDEVAAALELASRDPVKAAAAARLDRPSVDPLHLRGADAFEGATGGSLLSVPGVRPVLGRTALVTLGALLVAAAGLGLWRVASARGAPSAEPSSPERATVVAVAPSTSAAGPMPAAPPLALAAATVAPFPPDTAIAAAPSGAPGTLATATSATRPGRGSLSRPSSSPGSLPHATVPGPASTARAARGEVVDPWSQ